MGGRVQSPTFVGRIEELELLEAARIRAADADPAVVLVGGEAGVGKTRLVAELAARCAAEGMRVQYGGCVPVGTDGLPYAPIVEGLRPLPDELGIETVRELAGPSWRELARLLPSLGEPEAGLAGQAAQARLFELLLGLLSRLSRQTPITLVVEDLHWADQSTRDLLAFLVRNVRQDRILLVASYRSDEPGQQGLGAYLAELDRGGPVQRLELPRLDKVQTIAQLRRTATDRHVALERHTPTGCSRRPRRPAVASWTPCFIRSADGRPSGWTSAKSRLRGPDGYGHMLASSPGGHPMATGETMIPVGSVRPKGVYPRGVDDIP